MTGENLDSDLSPYGVNEHSIAEFKIAVGRAKLLEGAAEIALADMVETSGSDDSETPPEAPN